MMGGIPGDMPLIQPVDNVSVSAFIGLCVGALFMMCAVAMTWWLCRRRHEHDKWGPQEKSSSSRPVFRRPTTVKSPGIPCQYYYRKSSPATTPADAKILSPTEIIVVKKENSQHERQNQLYQELMPSYENECCEKLLNGELCERPLDNDDQSRPNVLGELIFRLRYLLDQNALVVTVVKCKELPMRGQSSSSNDSYVKVQLLPDKQHRTKTRVLRNTRNPIFDEDFTFFGITQAQLRKISLLFIVMSFDRYSRDSVIGEVVCSLGSLPDLDNALSQPLTMSREICPKSSMLSTQRRGELLVSLCWKPAIRKLTVVVLKARNLPKMDISGLADPYVKIYLSHNQERIAKRKTHIRRRTLNPIFNESIDFDIPNDADGLANMSLEFAMLDWDRVTKNEVIGRLVLGGPKCQGPALNHWNDVCNSPKRQIAEWHKLRE